MIMRNTLRDKLVAGSPTVGTYFLFADPDIPEMIGDTGLFDYGELVAEYSTFDVKLLYHLARAGRCGDLPLMIKLDQEGQGFWAQVALGAGFRAVLFTDVRTPEDPPPRPPCRPGGTAPTAPVSSGAGPAYVCVAVMGAVTNPGVQSGLK